jgi:hypothetical protein
MRIASPHLLPDDDDTVTVRIDHTGYTFINIGTENFGRYAVISGAPDTLHRILTDALHQLEEATRTCCPTGHDQAHLDVCDAEAA